MDMPSLLSSSSSTDAFSKFTRALGGRSLMNLSLEGIGVWRGDGSGSYPVVW